MTLSKTGKKLLVMILFTALFLFIFRIGSLVQMPFIDYGFFQQALAQGQDKIALGFIDVFSGGALSNFSILALGISPYITASIVIQLLQMDIVPRLKEWSEEGETGKQKINQVTRYVSLGLAFVQALTLTIGIKASYSDLYFSAGFPETAFTYVYLALVATAGTAFSLWLAEQITSKGIGNGTSILIVAGILASFPAMFYSLGDQYLTAGNTKGIITFFAIIIIFILIILGIVFMETAQRKIPIQYANRPAAASFRGKSDSNIPIKLNAASVIPVIFAATLMSLPTTIVQVAKLPTDQGAGKWLNMFFNQQEPAGFALYIILIFVFSFFYSFLQMNPEKMAENLQNNNAFIPGVRPGEDTASYLSRVLFKITMVGATYLAIIAAVPIIITKVFKIQGSAVNIGGTGLIIVVGVAIETVKQLQTVAQEKQYHGFMK